MTLTPTETGALIARLGQAIEEGTTRWETAIAELMAAPVEGGLTRQGAIGQLRAWRSAEQRYQFAADNAAARAARDDRFTDEPGPFDARSMRARPALHFRFGPRDASA